ncbi:hypothetical protein ABIB39_002907 [Mucilaginibacter sp. UYP27]
MPRRRKPNKPFFFLAALLKMFPETFLVFHMESFQFPGRYDQSIQLATVLIDQD